MKRNTGITFLFAMLFIFAGSFNFVSAKDYGAPDVTPITPMSSTEGDYYDDSDEDADGDYYDDGYDQEYTQNGPGDSFIKLLAMPNFPLNFGDKMTLGGQITVGYHRFLTSMLALGADLSFGYNPTIGGNLFTYVPITMGITFQPYIWRFEFPITLNVGAAIENYLSYTYFPGLIIRPEVGVFYRINENWSVGAECEFTYMPQWYANDHSKDDYLFLISAVAGVRYHF